MSKTYISRRLVSALMPAALLYGLSEAIAADATPAGPTASLPAAKMPTGKASAARSQGKEPSARDATKRGPSDEQIQGAQRRANAQDPPTSVDLTPRSEPYPHGPRPPKTEKFVQPAPRPLPQVPSSIPPGAASGSGGPLPQPPGTK